jgi:hypothetical protein
LRFIIATVHAIIGTTPPLVKQFGGDARGVLVDGRDPAWWRVRKKPPSVCPSVLLSQASLRGLAGPPLLKRGERSEFTGFAVKSRGVVLALSSRNGRI